MNTQSKIDLQGFVEPIHVQKRTNDDNKIQFQNANVIFRADAHSGHRTRVSANRTTEGTSPPGSMWTMNPLFPA